MIEMREFFGGMIVEVAYDPEKDVIDDAVVAKAFTTIEKYRRPVSRVLASPHFSVSQFFRARFLGSCAPESIHRIRHTGHVLTWCRAEFFVHDIVPPGVFFVFAAEACQLVGCLLGMTVEEVQDRMSMVVPAIVSATERKGTLQ